MVTESNVTGFVDKNISKETIIHRLNGMIENLKLQPHTYDYFDSIAHLDDFETKIDLIHGDHIFKENEIKHRRRLTIPQKHISKAIITKLENNE
eukprot:GAHX01004045.1.p1 GENE.GAHX01004045.1~~GAHX01004045.1.p1  ORF type:complete len:94 (+),score=13.31 GAHX01004045.1:319-600(+)